MIDSQQVEERAATAKIQSNRGFSIVWIVPIVALLIGAWLVFKAINENGPTVTLSFVSAEGLEAGKTKIKYRDVVVGQVEQITLSKDASHVAVTAKLAKEMEPYLGDKTKFWIVRAQVRGGSVSGLSTLFSGGYIGVDLSREGKPTKNFIGLEVPPVVTMGQPGRIFMLKANTLGSLNIGAPVYYRQIQVGQLVSYGFNQDGKAVDIQIFIEAPHDKQITTNTRFWNASGIDVSLDSHGLKVATQSMISIVSGGIAFDLPKDAPPGNEVKKNEIFHLYSNYDEIQEKKHSSVRNYWMLLLDESVRGLGIGAPVELYGIKIGEVVDLNLEFDTEKKKFQVPVVIAMEPERIQVTDMEQGQQILENGRENLVQLLVEKQGLRAQLKNGNMLTGQLVVNLVFAPDSPKASLSKRGEYWVLPTIPGSFEKLQDSLDKIITNFEKVPFDQIGIELQLVLKETRNTMNRLGGLAGKIDKETAPQIKTAVEELQKTLVEIQRTIGRDSPLQYNTNKAMEDLSLTLRAIRTLADTLDNRPQSVIFGKEEKSYE
jgi:paraquat-inducible protein B